MGFPLVQNSVTLNSVIAPILRYFAEFDSFRGRLGDYVTVVEDQPILS